MRLIITTMILALTASLSAQAEGPKVFKLPQDNHDFIQLKAPEGARFTLTLKGDEIATRDGKIHCEPGTRVRRSYYITYVFDLQAFQAAFPGYAKRGEVVIEGIARGVTMKKNEIPVGTIRLYEVQAELFASAAPPTPVYQQQEILKADFDAALIKEIDGITPPYPEGGEYQIGVIPTKAGEGQIYKLQAIIQGQVSYAPGPVPIHYLLMLKVNAEQIITEGYHYTLEWSDAPSLRLYAVTAEGLKLTDGLKIAALGLKNRAGEVGPTEGQLKLKLTAL